MVDFSRQAQELLGMADVHQDQRLSRGVGKGPDHLEAAPVGVEHAAFRKPEPSGKIFFEQDGPLIGEESKGVPLLAAGSPRDPRSRETG